MENKKMRSLYPRKILLVCVSCFYALVTIRKVFVFNSKFILEPTIDKAVLDQLIMMGFPEIRCKKALIATGNNGTEIAMNWLIEHMDDPGNNLFVS
jgi:hypothetical protein